MSVFQQGQKWHYAGAADRRKISTLSKQERKSKLLSAAARLPRSPPLFLHISSERVYLLKPISCFITKHPVKFNKTPPLHCAVSNVLSKYGVFYEQKYNAWGNASGRALWGWISHDYKLNRISLGEKRDGEGNIGMNTVKEKHWKYNFWRKAVMRSRECTIKNNPVKCTVKKWQHITVKNKIAMF